MPEAAAAEGRTFARATAYVGARVSEAVARIDPVRIAKAVDVILHAPATFVYGAGRSGIIGRAFAMRLVQAGVTAYVIGESVTPIVRRGDAVVILSARGESYSSIQTANIVRREGANLVVVTGRAASKLAHTATLLLTLDLPDDGERPVLAPLGTLFEAASLRLTDGLVAELMQARHETEDSMRARHAIMV
jgi:6-phospho 3-hexuloisomerase